MQALGNTETAQRRLFALNNATAIDIPGGEGEPAWASFEDFQARVCAADWYKPGGQMVVIDLDPVGVDGPFVALSAITRFAGADHAYNLHTGVDRRYRGRKLAQAVKVIALRYARDVLGVAAVHTHHTAVNAPMIAIDRKLGYVQAPGMYALAKNIGEG
jgi:RimJ/RimL family protein N-acetyltransferase